MAAPTWDRSLRAALVLPVRLLLLSFLVLLRLPYLLRRTLGGGRLVVLSSTLFLILVPILLSVIYTVSNPRTSNNAVSKLEEMKMKVVHLESKLEETTQALSSQTLFLEDKRKLVEEMERQAEFLENELFGTKDLVFTKYNEAIDQLYDMQDTVGRISLKDIDDYNTWLMNVCESTNDELVCIHDSLTLADFFRADNDDGENEEDDGDYMYDNDISSNDDEDDVFFDDDAEATEENDDYKFDEDIFSNVEDGDYDIDDDYFSFDDETKEDNDDDYKSNDVAYDDVFSEEAEENDDYKFDEDIFSDVEDGDYDIDDDYFSFDDETKGDNDDDYKSNDVAYGDVFLEEDTENDVFPDDDDGAWFSWHRGFGFFV